MSSFSVRRHRADQVGQWLHIQRLHPVHVAMLAALPVAILVVSPQRVFMSAGIAVAFVVAAVATARRDSIDRIVLAYLGAAALWMALMWLRSRFMLHLQPEQLSYATEKTAYFVLIVIPIAAALTLVMDRAGKIWPAALTQTAIGAAVALVTVLLLGARFLGYERYSWQGNLIALGMLIAIHPWPVQRFRASVILGSLGVAGIMLAGSRQAVAAAAVGLVLTAAYWGLSRFHRERGSTWSRFRAAIAGPYVLLPLVLLVLTFAYIGVTYASDTGAFGFGQASTSCHCVTDRIVSLETNAGDRDRLLARGAELFLANPILGSGLGSFAGAVPDSLRPGQFYQYPHNVPLEIAAETGIVGLLLMIGPLLVGWAALFWHGVRQSSPAIAVALMFVALYFTVANLSGDIPSERGMWIFGAVAFKLGIDFLRTRHIPRILARAA